MRYVAYVPQLSSKIVANLNWFSTPFIWEIKCLREKSNNWWLSVDYAAMLPFGIQYLVFLQQTINLVCLARYKININ